MADKDHAAALVSDAADGTGQLITLGGGEHSRGLIQHQDLAVAVQGLQDLDPLLLAHGQLPHLGVGIDEQLILVTELLEFFSRRCQIQHRLVGGHTQDDIFDDGQRIHQLKVLVHHADAVLDGLTGGVDAYLLAVDKHLSLVGGIQTVKYIHKGRLTRAVFTQQTEDFALITFDSYMVICKDTRKCLGDILHSQSACSFCHREFSTSLQRLRVKCKKPPTRREKSARFFSPGGRTLNDSVHSDHWRDFLLFAIRI